MMRPWMAMVLALALLASAGCGWFGEATLLEADFETDPLAAGWTLESRPGGAARGEWAAGGAAASRCLVVGEGYWQDVECYVDEHSQATFSHGICPDCVRNLYPELDISS